MAITALPTAPASTDSRATFSSKMFAWIAALATFRTEANAQAAAITALSAGTAVGIPYTFSTTTTDADPGAGFLRLDNATQNLATTIRADLAGSDGTTYTDVLATFDDSDSTIKGHITLQKIADPTKWIIFTVSALASPSGYKNLTVAVVAASEASPFANGDGVVLKFTRTGDKGATGADGATGAAGADGSEITLGTHVASTSGTDIDFTGIPSGTKLIVITLNGVSLSGTNQILIQLGDAGGIEDNAYTDAGIALTAASGVQTSNDGSAFSFRDGTHVGASGTRNGLVILALERSNTNTWTCFGGFGTGGTPTNFGMFLGAGVKSLSAELDRVRIKAASGDTFDAGEINIAYL